jgi:putative spermidine/putrescine transport system permease protein
VSGGWRFGLVLAGAWTLALYLVLPMVVVFPVSLTDQRYLSLPQHAPSLQHYANLFANPFWLSSIAQSLVVATISTTLAVTLGTLCAIGCWRLASGAAGFVRLLMILPLVVPAIVHALGFFRMWIDLDLIDSFPGVILAHVITSLPYVVITVSAALANFDLRLEQAARNLGASVGQTIGRVILPNILPGVVTGGVFAFVHAWDEIVVLLFITSRHVYLLPRAIWDGINENVDPTIAAIASLMILLTAGALFLQGLGKRRGEPRAAVAAEEASPLAAGTLPAQ